MSNCILVGEVLLPGISYGDVEITLHIDVNGEVTASVLHIQTKKQFSQPIPLQGMVLDRKLVVRTDFPDSILVGPQKVDGTVTSFTLKAPDSITSFRIFAIGAGQS